MSDRTSVAEPPSPGGERHRFCPKCGARAETGNFCKECGASVMRAVGQSLGGLAHDDISPTGTDDAQRSATEVERSSTSAPIAEVLDDMSILIQLPVSAAQPRLEEVLNRMGSVQIDTTSSVAQISGQWKIEPDVYQYTATIATTADVFSIVRFSPSPATHILKEVVAQLNAPWKPSYEVNQPRRGWSWGIGAGLAVLLLAAGVIFGVPQVHDRIFPSAGSSASSTPTQPSTSTFNLATQWNRICSQEAGSNGWTDTDSQGNKAIVSVCGFTLTGEDATQTSAPAGQLYINIVLHAQAGQTDRGAGVRDFFIDIAPLGVRCSNAANNHCIRLSTNFYDLAGSGAISRDSSPTVQPGFPQMYFVSTLTPIGEAGGNLDLVVNPGGKHCVSAPCAAGSQFTSNLGAGKENLPLFSAP